MAEPQKGNADIDVSLVIACYNEEQVLEENLKRVDDILALTRYRYEIIIVDDCSKDTTRMIIERIAPSFPRLRVILHDQNQGRGKTVTDGIMAAKGRVVGFIDIDLETSESYIPSMVMKVINGADVVVALRIYRFYFHSLIRYVLSRGYVFLVRLILAVPFLDTEAGCKFFNREKILPVLAEIEDHHWFWDTEIMVRSYYRDYRIDEMPTLFVRNREVRSTVRIFKDTFYYFRKIIGFRSRLKEIKNARS